MKRWLVLVAVLAAAVGASCGGKASDHGDPDVYRLRIELKTPRSDISRIVVSAPSTEWIEPSSGRFRIESDSGSVHIYDGRSYAWENHHEVWVRTGSPSFVGVSLNQTTAGRALRAHLTGALGSEYVTTISPSGKTELRFYQRPEGDVVATIEETLSREQADERGIFAIPHARATRARTERPPGARPRVAIRPYWLGRRFAGRAAVCAVEANERRAARLLSSSYTVYYGEGECTSAEPEGPSAVTELQLVSQALASSASHGSLIRLYQSRAGWRDETLPPSFRIRLRNGETATVIPDSPDGGLSDRAYWVVTRTTVVVVDGWLPNPRASLAQLRPVA